MAATSNRQARMLITAGSACGVAVRITARPRNTSLNGEHHILQFHRPAHPPRRRPETAFGNAISHIDGVPSRPCVIEASLNGYKKGKATMWRRASVRCPPSRPLAGARRTATRSRYPGSARTGSGRTLAAVAPANVRVEEDCYWSNPLPEDRRRPGRPWSRPERWPPMNLRGVTTPLRSSASSKGNRPKSVPSLCRRRPTCAANCAGSCARRGIGGAERGTGGRAGHPVRSGCGRPPPRTTLPADGGGVGLLARQQLTCGQHVHVSVQSRAEGVGVGPDRAVALGVAGDFGELTVFWQAKLGYQSYRTLTWNRWPSAGRWPGSATRPVMTVQSPTCSRPVRRSTAEWSTSRPGCRRSTRQWRSGSPTCAPTSRTPC